MTTSKSQMQVHFATAKMSCISKQLCAVYELFSLNFLQFKCFECGSCSLKVVITPTPYMYLHLMQQLFFVLLVANPPLAL